MLPLFKIFLVFRNIFQYFNTHKVSNMINKTSVHLNLLLYFRCSRSYLNLICHSNTFQTHSSLVIPESQHFWLSLTLLPNLTKNLMLILSKNSFSSCRNTMRYVRTVRRKKDSSSKYREHHRSYLNRAWSTARSRFLSTAIQHLQHKARQHLYGAICKLNCHRHHVLGSKHSFRRFEEAPEILRGGVNNRSHHRRKHSGPSSQENNTPLNGWYLQREPTIIQVVLFLLN